jgi:hypothetical protein
VTAGDESSFFLYYPREAVWVQSPDAVESLRQEAADYKEQLDSANSELEELRSVDAERK